MVIADRKEAMEVSKDIYDYQLLFDSRFNSVNVTGTQNNNFDVDAQVECDGKGYQLNFNCDLYTFDSSNMMVYNKAVAKVNNSNYEILNFSVCKSNDILNPDYIIEEGQALIKIAFVSHDIQSVISANIMVDLSEYDALSEFIEKEPNFKDLTELERNSLLAAENWETPFSEENVDYEEINMAEPNDNALEIFENDIIERNTLITDEIECETESEVEILYYKSNGTMDSTAPAEEISDTVKMRALSSIVGDTALIVNSVVPESWFKTSACRSLARVDEFGDYDKAFHTDTIYVSSNKSYLTSGVIWDVGSSVVSANGSYSDPNKVVEFRLTRAYNFYAYYYPSQDKIQITFLGANDSMVPTGKNTLSVGSYGKNDNSYVSYLYAAAYEGGSQTSSGTAYFASVLGLCCSAAGKIIDPVLFAIDTYETISGFTRSDNTTYFKAISGKTLKCVGTPYANELYKQHSLLKARIQFNNTSSGATKLSFSYDAVRYSCPLKNSDEKIHIRFYRAVP